jgi:hypothetical protein
MSSGQRVGENLQREEVLMQEDKRGLYRPVDSFSFGKENDAGCPFSEELLYWLKVIGGLQEGFTISVDKSGKPYLDDKRSWTSGITRWWSSQNRTDTISIIVGKINSAIDVIKSCFDFKSYMLLSASIASFKSLALTYKSDGLALEIVKYHEGFEKVMEELSSELHNSQVIARGISEICQSSLIEPDLHQGLPEDGMQRFRGVPRKYESGQFLGGSDRDPNRSSIGQRGNNQDDGQSTTSDIGAQPERKAVVARHARSSIEDVQDSVQGSNEANSATNSISSRGGSGIQHSFHLNPDCEYSLPAPLIGSHCTSEANDVSHSNSKEERKSPQSSADWGKCLFVVFDRPRRKARKSSEAIHP